ncbi:hypothetical protein PoB_001665300 [Plakobranchus ocellatus]|uniref:Uncharacterized protein n=1 Tax=Plakobranchus ocellatus TaxID=259542 RepID=A0AAV3Z6C0_9GAST|nr:hypothetical protein PoB_001665300 [Plakobranchus ocellatus]
MSNDWEFEPNGTNILRKSETNDNVRRFREPSSEIYSATARNRQKMTAEEHVLISFKTPLGQGSYTWRHNRELQELVIAKCNAKGNVTSIHIRSGTKFWCGSDGYSEEEHTG